MIDIALLGFGTVGGGVAEVLQKNSALISSRLGDDVNIKYILDLRDFPDSPFADRIVHDGSVIINDPQVTVVAEMMGGIHPAADLTRRCLEAGKSVVTSNKAVVAEFGDELLELARARGVRYLFEAAVGGGIPVIRPLTDELADNEIVSIAGILNGTTNYILTEMKAHGTSFADALRRARELGYAEADPSADVDGFDAARKILIMAAIAYGKLLPLDAVNTRGIRDIPTEDVSLVSRLGASIKLIAFAQRDPKVGGIYASAEPRVVLPACPLCHVDDVFNGVLIEGNMLGETMFYGRGAGKLPTASAVVSDILDAVERPAVVQQRLIWSRAAREDIADANGYACRRCFILDTDSEKFAYTEGDGFDVTGEGMRAVFSADALTDPAAAERAESYAGHCLRIYKVI